MDFTHQDEIIASLALRYTKGVGDIGMHRIRKIFGSMARATASSLEEWIAYGFGREYTQKILAHIDYKKAEQEVAYAQKQCLDIRLWGTSKYPQRLAHCPDAPYAIFTRGVCDFPHHPIIAVVGTRRATSYGIRMVSEILEGLAHLCPMVVSGLAYGIDIAAHRKSLELGIPTVAVLGHNFSTLYPEGHRSEAKRMESQGGLISDIPSFTPFHNSGFPQRNRIIAGISDVLIVVESPAKGGALITANLANSYHREVYAVPGRNSDAMSEGCNRLIMLNKARIFFSAEELISCMRWNAVSSKKKNANQRGSSPALSDRFAAFPEDQRKILEFLSQGKQSFDAIQESLTFAPPKLYKELLQLELQGVLHSLPARHYKLVSD